ncbi:unnamed protein product [Pedinophyceae sp. YPF-701]|nr:unnamed protein product [Pedinophyceae sp. YPF-701]
MQASVAARPALGARPFSARDAPTARAAPLPGVGRVGPPAASRLVQSVQRSQGGMQGRSEAHVVRAEEGKVGKVQIGQSGKTNIRRAALAIRRFGYVSFWAQLGLSLVSAIVLLFSVAFSRESSQSVSLYFTLFGIMASILSTFWAFGYTRLARTMFKYGAYLEGKLKKSDGVKEVTKYRVYQSLVRGVIINMAGFGATVLGMQATVGLLVAKTLTSATANPFLAGGASSWNPVLALDVFLVQASANTLLAHFVSLCVNLLLMRQLALGGAVSDVPGTDPKAQPA